DPCLRAADIPAAGAILDRHTIYQQPMHAAIPRHWIRALGPGEFAEGIFQRFGRQSGVEPRERIAKALFQHDLPIVGALGGWLAGGNLRPVPYRPADAFKPCESSLF